MELVFLMIAAIVMLLAGIAFITTYSTELTYSLVGIICVFIAGASIITIIDVHNKKLPQKMIITYELKDSVYIPIDTVIN